MFDTYIRQKNIKFILMMQVLGNVTRKNNYCIIIWYQTENTAQRNEVPGLCEVDKRPGPVIVWTEH